MPKYEIGPKVMVLGIAVIAAVVLITVVALGAKDVALHLIDVISKLGTEMPSS